MATPPCLKFVPGGPYEYRCVDPGCKCRVVSVRDPVADMTIPFCEHPGCGNLCSEPRKDRVYIAGPMTGKPDFNYPAFFKARDKWKEVGCDVLCPAENFGGDTTREYREYIKADLAMLLEADAIVLLPGWEQSRGARFELHVAQLLGLEVYRDDLSVISPASVPTVQTTLVQPDDGERPPETILAEAQRLVHGDRGAAYGHPYYDYLRTSRAWEALLGMDEGTIGPHKAALMMIVVKLSREFHKPKRDNRTDICGYAECGDMIVNHPEFRGA